MSQNISTLIQNACDAMCDEQFQRVIIEGETTSDQLTEIIRSQTAPLIEDIIAKLRKNSSLSSEEKQLLKNWIIGDAIGFLAMENSLSFYLNELQRQQALVLDFEQNLNQTIDTLIQYRGALENISQLARMLAEHLYKKKRIQQFECAMQKGLGSIERQAFISILLNKLKSPEESLNAQSQKHTSDIVTGKYDSAVLNNSSMDGSSSGY